MLKRLPHHHQTPMAKESAGRRVSSLPWGRPGHLPSALLSLGGADVARTGWSLGTQGLHPGYTAQQAAYGDREGEDQVTEAAPRGCRVKLKCAHTLHG